MKPRIYRKGAAWFCSYYKGILGESGKGHTPYLAWYSWKYRLYHGV